MNPTHSPEHMRMMRERSALARRARAAGWDDVDAYRVYLDDPDGGRSPVRVHRLPYPDLTPTAAEAASWEA